MTDKPTTIPLSEADMPQHVRPISLRRFSPKQINEFQKKRRNQVAPIFSREDTPHIVFPKNARFVSDFPMTHAELKAVSDLMFAGQKMKEASERLLQMLPEGAKHQFFGNWDLLRISNKNS